MFALHSREVCASRHTPESPHRAEIAPPISVFYCNLHILFFFIIFAQVKVLR